MRKVKPVEDVQLLDQELDAGGDEQVGEVVAVDLQQKPLSLAADWIILIRRLLDLQTNKHHSHLQVGQIVAVDLQTIGYPKKHPYAAADISSTSKHHSYLLKT